MTLVGPFIPKAVLVHIQLQIKQKQTHKISEMQQTLITSPLDYLVVRKHNATTLINKKQKHTKTH